MQNWLSLQRFFDRASRARALALGVVVVVFLLGLGGSEAWAHGTGTSRGDYRQHPGGAEAWVAMPGVDLLLLAPALDRNGNGELDGGELTRSEQVDAQLLDALPATRGEVACAGTVLEVGPDRSDPRGALFGIRYAPCAGDAADVAIGIGSLLSKLPAGHTQAAFLHVGDGEPQQSLVYGKDASVRVPLDREAAPPPPESAWQVAKKCVVLGVEHIVFGFDHVVFLIGLVLLRGRARDYLTMVTAFTVAHSLTLALTVLGVVAPPVLLIEALIALSVAYVGVENFFIHDVAKRWRVTAPFGLIHGFGFAAAVGEKLPRENLPVALGTFNLGVELGQLGLLLLFVPLFAWLRRWQPFDKWGVRVISAAIVVAGLYWFVERVFLA